MKVLMLHDCAYVGYELTKELVNLDVVVTTLCYYNNLGFNISKGYNLLKMLIQTKKSDCDLIHAHYLGSAAVIAYLSRKPYIVHVHGSDVRNKKLSRMQKRVLKKAKTIVYGTQDLKPFLPEDAVYLPTPVGNQFRNMHNKRTIKTAYRTVRYEEPEVFVDNCVESIPYEYMPYILNLVETFYDRHTIPCLSKTAFEALACGCTVINGDQHIQGLPEEHKAKNVALQLEGIYQNVIYA